MTRRHKFTLFDRHFSLLALVSKGWDRIRRRRPSRGADAMAWAGRLQAEQGGGSVRPHAGWGGVGTYLRLQLTPVQVVDNYSKLMISHGFAREIKLKRSLVLEFDTFNLLYRIVNNPIYTRANTTVSTIILNKMLRWLTA